MIKRKIYKYILMASQAIPQEFPESIAQSVDVTDPVVGSAELPQDPPVDEVVEEQPEIEDDDQPEEQVPIDVPSALEEVELTVDPEPVAPVARSTVAPGPATKSVNKKMARAKTKPGGIYTSAVITRKVTVGIENVGRTLKQNLETLVSSEIEGKCIVEGFIKPGSTKLLTYNSGFIRNGRIVFEVVFECMACCPVEGMLIDCVAKNITKAGIRAEIDGEKSPVVVFVARDHNHLSEYFSSITENDAIKVRVIGQRFELNDKYVSVIAEIVEQKEQPKIRRSKPKLLITK